MANVSVQIETRIKHDLSLSFQSVAGDESLNVGTLVKSIFCQRQQFGDGGQVPIGIGYMGVPQVGGEHGQTLFNINAGSVPMEKRGYSKAVAKIMQTWSEAIGSLSQTHLT